MVQYSIAFQFAMVLTGLRVQRITLTDPTALELDVDGDHVSQNVVLLVGLWFPESGFQPLEKQLRVSIGWEAVLASQR